MNNQSIYINGRFLTRSISGVERFSIEICNALVKINPNIKIIAPKKAKNQKSINNSNVIYFGKYSGHFWEQVILPIFLKRNNKPLLLNLANTAPVFYSKKIISIHDIAFKEHPEWFNTIFSKYYNFLIPLLLKTSNHVLTVSEFSKEQIYKSYTIAKSKISVIYNGLSESFLNNSVNTTPIDYKYILTVASLQPRKNLLRLIEAYKQISNPEFKLVIVGSSNKVFKTVFNKSNINYENVIIKENINDKELGSLYKGAEKFIFPSLYEGFGLPILEALHFNCPVAASNIPVFKELFGYVISYFDPYNIGSIKQSLLEGVPNGKIELKNQIKNYNFGSSAKQIIGIIEKV
jgi:glycosyltransferase involved in cell wall biosynthesis